MPALRLVLGDQLSTNISSLRGTQKDRDIVLMTEVAEECTSVRKHKQKIVLVLSAMRHFSIELSGLGYPMRYIRLDDENNTGTFTD